MNIVGCLDYPDEGEYLLDGEDVSGPSFKDELTRSLEAVNNQMLEADRKTEALVSGQSGDLHGTIIAMQKADLSFRMLVEVRNKAIRAYEEVMRMQA
ncbi:MAG: Flagellar hook-basal body complex protein FliE [candidate division BRC1 bacterium ADurb.BinA292]|nr:MAG: Flagellar hook-basal body complex protein FliE [candidate division BRC1 bacterium ADurb.BinA292]